MYGEQRYGQLECHQEHRLRDIYSDGINFHGEVGNKSALASKGGK